MQRFGPSVSYRASELNNRLFNQLMRSKTARRCECSDANHSPRFSDVIFECNHQGPMSQIASVRRGADAFIKTVARQLGKERDDQASDGRTRQEMRIEPNPEYPGTRKRPCISQEEQAQTPE